MINKKGRITGLGGVFFKSENPDQLKKWYENNLGLPCDAYGHLFSWRHTDSPDKKGYTQWSVFSKDSEYMNPSSKDFMLNFRVENLDLLVEELKANGMHLVGEPESYEYGKFAWVMDPDGNKIELWEPIDETFTEMVEADDNNPDK